MKDIRPEIIVPGEPPGGSGRGGQPGQPTQALVPASQPLPLVLPGVQLEGAAPFPQVVFPLLVREGKEADAVEHARANGGYLALVPPNPTPRGAPDAGADAGAAQAHGLTLTITPGIGVAAQVLRDFVLPDGERSVLLKVLSRLVVEERMREEPFLIAKVRYPAETVADHTRLAALVQQVRAQLGRFIHEHPHLPDEAEIALFNVSQPGDLADLWAQQFVSDPQVRLAILSAFDLEARLHLALEVLLREIEFLGIGNRISAEIQARVNQQQKEFFLREQLKAIRKELGEEKDSRTLQREELAARLAEAKLPMHAATRAAEELRRLETIALESPEYQLTRSYLEWLAELPWAELTTDRVDLKHARRQLDADHHGLARVKERILEFLAVRRLRQDPGGTILCLAGPPGVGKTSLGQSIAHALGRKFFRFSLGGMRDEAEIKGHRRTYIGALPGKILQGLRTVAVANPVFMLDEIDKLGRDWRGDPSSALLEVLDPAQNVAFLDHYLDLPFDLSRVLFIATANTKSEIPAPLLDRMEVLDLPGYLLEEKVQIAARHLVPRLRQAHGLTRGQLRLSPAVLRALIQGYTREAGVRDCERHIAALCRKAASAIVARRRWQPAVSRPRLTQLLGHPPYRPERHPQRPAPGVALGLAWTPAGGEVLKIEVAAMPGKGGLSVTGQLGEVMRESVTIALSCVRAAAASLGVSAEALKRLSEQDLHIHFPAGAVPKDGPSAGVTIAAAYFSLATGRRLLPGLAMTGELTLTGEVLPVGGIREKLVAAVTAGVRTVIIPERNATDLSELPPAVRARLRVVRATTLAEVLTAAFNGRPVPKHPR